MRKQKKNKLHWNYKVFLYNIIKLLFFITLGIIEIYVIFYLPIAGILDGDPMYM